MMAVIVRDEGGPTRSGRRNYARGRRKGGGDVGGGERGEVPSIVIHRKGEVKVMVKMRVKLG